MDEDDDEQVIRNNLEDRFRFCAAGIADVEARRNGMDISDSISACIADLALKYAEQVAKDVQLFAWHARRKLVKVEDVIVSTHRNENLGASLRSLHNDLVVNTTPKSDRRRRRAAAATSNIIYNDQMMPEHDHDPLDDQDI